MIKEGDGRNEESDGVARREARSNLGRTKISIETLRFDFQPYRAAPYRAFSAEKSAGEEGNLATSKTIDLGLLLSGYATSTKTSRLSSLSTKPSVTPKSARGARGCGKRCVGGGADTCVRRAARYACPSVFACPCGRVA